MIANLPSLIVNCGEPSGIGLDLIVLLSQKKFPALITVLANKKALSERAKILKQKITFNTSLSKHNGDGSIFVIDVSYPENVSPGEPNKRNSFAQLKMIDFAVDKCLRKEYSALVTLPISKEILSSSTKKFTGHTEYISKLTNNDGQEVMLLAHKKLKVALTTTHVPLSQVSKHITQDKLINVISTLYNDLKHKFKILDPRITITGLNPHAGEGGQFGLEEREVISPVIKKFLKKGLDIKGPIPADTAFTPKYLKNTDCFLAMFHDQGLAPFKALSFGEGVNVTLGLPLIRTSVDHGTAFDLVGSKNINASSFFEAINMAIKLKT